MQPNSLAKYDETKALLLKRGLFLLFAQGIETFQYITNFFSVAIRSLLTFDTNDLLSCKIKG